MHTPPSAPNMCASPSRCRMLAMREARLSCYIATRFPHPFFPYFWPGGSRYAVSHAHVARPHPRAASLSAQIWHWISQHRMKNSVRKVQNVPKVSSRYAVVSDARNSRLCEISCRASSPVARFPSAAIFATSLLPVDFSWNQHAPEIAARHHHFRFETGVYREREVSIADSP